MVRRISLVLLFVAGLALIVLGATWKKWHSPQQLWSRQQASEHTNALRALKLAATSRQRPNDPNDEQKIAAAQARFDAINAQLEHAKTLNTYSGAILIVLGVVAITISAWLFASLASETSKQING